MHEVLNPNLNNTILMCLYFKLLATFAFSIQLTSIFFAINPFIRQGNNNNCGIYYTREDYLSRKLIQPAAIPCKCKIKAKRNIVAWECGKEKRTFNSKDIFGYTLEGETYFIKDDTTYKLEEKGAVYILSKEIWVPIYKGGYSTREYYYIKDLDQFPKRITYNNLVSDFQQSPSALNILQENKQKDFSEKIYSDGNKLFYINYLLK